MTGVQLIAIVFGVGMGFFTYMSFRRRELTVAEFALWFTVWLALIAVSAFPDTLRQIIGPLKVARLLDLVMIAGTLFLSALVFYLHRTTRRMQLRIVELVRKLALSSENTDGNG